MVMENLNDLNFANRKYGAWRGIQKSVTLSDAAGKGAIGTVALFTVTGDVEVKVIGICTTVLAGATATLEVGVTGKTAGLIAQTTGTDIDANELWHDATPDSPIEAASVFAEKIIANGSDIFITVGTAAVTSGAIRFVCQWRPLSRDGDVIPV